MKRVVIGHLLRLQDRNGTAPVLRNGRRRTGRRRTEANAEYSSLHKSITPFYWRTVTNQHHSSSQINPPATKLTHSLITEQLERIN